MDMYVKNTNQKINLATGVIFSERYLLNGRLHRDPSEGPASISRDEETGGITWERYKLHGRFHRERGPAEISRNAEGNPINETYWLNNLIHRDTVEGPAVIEHQYENGYLGGRELISIETYMIAGREYRNADEGPFWIVRDMITGKIISQEFTASDDHKSFGPRIPQRRSKKLKGAAP